MPRVVLPGTRRTLRVANCCCLLVDRQDNIRTSTGMNTSPPLAPCPLITASATPLSINHALGIVYLIFVLFSLHRWWLARRRRPIRKLLPIRLRRWSYQVLRRLGISPDPFPNPAAPWSAPDLLRPSGSTAVALGLVAHSPLSLSQPMAWARSCITSCTIVCRICSRILLITHLYPTPLLSK